MAPAELKFVLKWGRVERYLPKRAETKIGTYTLNKVSPLAWSAVAAPGPRGMLERASTGSPVQCAVASALDAGHG